jgi:hypothetical protein
MGHLLTYLRRYVRKPSFKDEIISTKSAAAGNLARWINNLYQYIELVEEMKK